LGDDRIGVRQVGENRGGAVTRQFVCAVAARRNADRARANRAPAGDVSRRITDDHTVGPVHVDAELFAKTTACNVR
jgi:hypothetical protein